MKKHIISTNKAPAAVGTYSQAVAVTVGTTVYLSGQIPLVPETRKLLMVVLKMKFIRSLKT